MYAFNWALTAFRSESYIGSATALPDNIASNTYYGLDIRVLTVCVQAYSVYTICVKLVYIAVRHELLKHT